MIGSKDWIRYITRLKAISDKAAQEMQAYVDRFGFDNTTAVIHQAYVLATKYGEAAGSAACDMYDAVAAASRVSVPAAEPAATATYGEVAKAVNGALNDHSEGQVPQIVGRKVKQAGADTTLKNAIRDGAEFAWVPHGDTCAFCITLASRGWQYASKAALKGGHAEHIHSNCDCEYAIRFDDKGGVRGYDPEKYKKIYYGADPNGSSKDKINAIRREQYQKNKEKINEQKREAYARNRKLKYGGQSDFNTDSGIIHAKRVDRYGYNNIYVDDEIVLNERQLRNINKQVSSAKEALGITDSCNIPIIITEMSEGQLASYNPKTNVVRISNKMSSGHSIKVIQQGFACPEDMRSTAIHELYHWIDAEEYRNQIGPISDASPTSVYSIYQKEKAKKALVGEGVNLNDPRELAEISRYALESALANNWEEVYTEFRTQRLLVGS